jgi:hypothetical protein
MIRLNLASKITSAVLLAILLPVLPSSAQTCAAPPVPVFSPTTMLSAEQETWVGDLMAQSLRADLRIIEDDELAQPLRRIGARLQKFAPQDSPTFSFHVVDMPIANAFTIVGGRVYVTRKAIALARNEDEIVGLLAHEMGHVLTRQTAMDFHQLFREVLKVESLGDRNDVENRFHELLDKQATNKRVWGKLAKKSDKDQLSADNMSIHLAARAGYSTAAFADYFDRLTENRGKKGNWFTDWTRSTGPESKRYREILKAGSPVSAGCVEKPDRIGDDAFGRWRQAVVNYRGFGKKESLPSGTVKRVMKEPLREQISTVRFSPDAKYLLAQDGSSIYVLTRQPFQTLFRIDAEDARPAQFTPDSKSLIFHSRNNRVEKWDIATQQQTEADEVYTLRTCMQSALSPKGDSLACVHMTSDWGLHLDLEVYNVQSGEVTWKKKDVFDIDYWNYLFVYSALREGRTVYLIPLAFSPDGRYLLGSDGSAPFAYDFNNEKEMPLTDLLKFKDYINNDFVFIAADKIFGRFGDKGQNSSIVQFPSGKILKADIPVGPLGLYPASKGNYVVLRPAVHAAAGLIDLDAKKIFVASKTPAIDISDDLFVNERVNGELGLYDKATGKLIMSTQLPLGPLTRFAAVAVSPDLRFVGYSERMRGALWSMDDGSRLMYLRGFRGAHFDDTGTMIVSFPAPDSYNEEGAITKSEAKARTKDQWADEQRKKQGTSTAKVDTVSKNIAELASFEKRFEARQIGPYLLVSPWRTADGDEIKDRELEVRDAVSGRTLWTRKFSGRGLPSRYYNLVGNTVAFIWSPQEDDGKALLKTDSALKAKMQALSKRKNARIVEVLDLATGKQKFVLPIDTGEGSFEISDVDVVGDTTVLTDSSGRLLVFNPQGERTARIFARRPVFDRTGKLMVASLEPGRVALYDSPSMHQRTQFTFPAYVVHTQFAENSKTLVVITSDQAIYTVPLETAFEKK